MWILFFAIILTGTAARANLITNGEFNESILGWTNTSSTYSASSWHPFDVDNSIISGSLELQTWITNGSSTGPWQCVLLAETGTYEGRAWIYLPAPQTPMPYPQMRLRSFGTTDCTGTVTASDTSMGSVPYNEWAELQTSLVCKRSCQSIEVRLLSGVTNSGATVEDYFDSVSLVLVPEPNLSILTSTALAVLAILCLRKQKETGAAPPRQR